VGDGDDRARKVRQCGLQLFDEIRGEVVRRFIEQ
jgi:hypothetical protein